MECPTKIIVGVLEIQGAFLEHKICLQKAMVEIQAESEGKELQLEVREVRHANHITSDLQGLIIPGGESTTISLFLKNNNMEEPLRRWVEEDGHVTWGTCAGMILLAKETEHQKSGGQISLQCMDTVVSRNYFGRQINSFEKDIVLMDPDLLTRSDSSTDLFHGVFIRAPAILRITSDDVTSLATISSGNNSSVTVAARQKNILCTAFHPELTEDTRWHKYFINMVLQRHKPC